MFICKVNVVLGKLNLEEPIVEEEIEMIYKSFEPFCDPNEKYEAAEFRKKTPLMEQLSQSANNIEPQKQTPNRLRTQAKISKPFSAETSSNQTQSYADRSSQIQEVYASSTQENQSNIKKPNPVNEKKSNKRFLEEILNETLGESTIIPTETTSKQNQSHAERSSQIEVVYASTQQNQSNIQKSNPVKSNKRFLEEILNETMEESTSKIQKIQDHSSASQFKSQIATSQLASQTQLLKNITNSIKPSLGPNDWDDKDLEMDD